jgi:hypothetical protein
MGTPTCTTGLALSTRLPDSGGAPLGTIQDFRDMGREDMGQDIAQGIPIIIPVPAIPRADRFLTPVDQALVLRLQRMHRHECSSGRTRSCEDSTTAVY